MTAVHRAALRVRVLAALAPASGPLDYSEVGWALGWTSAREVIRDELDELAAEGAVVRTIGLRSYWSGPGRAFLYRYETPVYALAGR